MNIVANVFPRDLSRPLLQNKPFYSSLHCKEKTWEWRLVEVGFIQVLDEIGSNVLICVTGALAHQKLHKTGANVVCKSYQRQ